jgi:two-component system cell cycle response regulator
VTSTRRASAALRAAQAGAGLLFAAYVAQALIPNAADHVGDFFETWVYPGLTAIAAAFCLTRAALRRLDRAAWLIIGLGVLASAGGDVWWYLARYDYRETIPAFTPADALWLAFYPACFVGICLLVRSRIRRLHRGLALDALIGALGMAAVGAALVWGALVNSGVTDLGGDFPADLANLFGDLVLIGVASAAFAVTGWRPGRALGLLGTGLLIAAGADGFYLWQGATGSEFGSTAITALTPGSLLLVGFAAWQAPPARMQAAAQREGWRMVAMPAVFAFAALGVILVHAFAPRQTLALALAVATLAAVIVRMAVALTDHTRLLVASRREALTDALTGLGNRRSLMLELDAEVEAASEEDPRAVMLFDLDGFKQFNDWHGHPAGDALLRRLGERLAAAVGPNASAYRLGGDEFCVLAAGDETETRRVRSAAIDALADVDGGFEVGSSCGFVMVPRDAGAPASVLQLADERLYAEKARRRRFSVGHQATSALVQALQEREPDLGEHLHDVAELVRVTAVELGMDGETLEQAVRAAELHDVGKVAVPDSILRKPGPLSEAEWGFMREHTIVGDRILSAAPALEGVAKLVRASHERFDGCGYPDQLAGEQIPLGARIIAVCDAFHAMTSDRPYRPAVAVHAALEELSRCAGQQFDPAVVLAFTKVVGGLRAASAAPTADAQLNEWATPVPAPADATRR